MSLREQLEQLGVDRDRVRLVALLPLVRVAWADGAVQAPERALIVEIAAGAELFGPGDREVVEGWLMQAPSADFLQTLEQVLGELARYAVFPEARGLVDQCKALARAAGGLFGTGLLAISPEEGEAIAQMARVLGVTAP